MTRIPELAPIHPAEHLREDFLKPLDMNEAAAAAALHMRVEDLVPFLQKRAPLTGDLALRLERAFGCDAAYWMRWQSGYELETARDRADADLDAIERVIAA